MIDVEAQLSSHCFAKICIGNSMNRKNVCFCFWNQCDIKSKNIADVLYIRPSVYLVLELYRAASDRLTFTDDSLGSLRLFRVSFTVIPRLRRVSVQSSCPYFFLLRRKNFSCQLSLLKCTCLVTTGYRYSGAFASSMFRSIAAKLFVSLARRRFSGHPQWRSDIFHGEPLSTDERKNSFCRAIAPYIRIIAILRVTIRGFPFTRDLI